MLSETDFPYPNMFFCAQDTMMDCGGDGGGLEDFVNLATDITNSSPAFRGKIYLFIFHFLKCKFTNIFAYFISYKNLIL